MDDSAANSHEGTTSNGDSLLFRGGTTGTFLGTLAANSGTGLLGDGVSYSFWLRYIQTSGTIEIGSTTDRTTVLYTGTDTSATKLAVEHIFVLSSVSSASEASFKICHPASM